MKNHIHKFPNNHDLDLLRQWRARIYLDSPQRARTEASKSVSSGKGLEDEDDKLDGTP